MLNHNIIILERKTLSLLLLLALDGYIYHEVCEVNVALCFLRLQHRN